MTTFDTQLGPHTLQGKNPYEMGIDSTQYKELVAGLVTERQPMYDSVSHPDLVMGSKEYSVFAVHGSDEFANASRAVEGVVTQEVWGDPFDEIREKSKSYELSSLFFVVVDVTEEPEIAATLRTADLRFGGSETVNYFEDKNPDTELPSELTLSEYDLLHGVWDIVNIMAPKGHRNFNASAWAYASTIDAAYQQGIARFVSNIKPDEMNNLNAIGVPFTRIPGTQDAVHERPGIEPVPFGFYSLNVPNLRPSIAARIAQLEAAQPMTRVDKKLWSVANIALSGSIPKIGDPEQKVA